ncbi:MAG: hypothetical protein JO168_04530, partial [Solirubrobacterales bacterium]|nr:hypothetical protein [Solirubrobacterales bacterium]
RYLQRQLSATRLPDCSSAAKATITAAGPLPTQLQARLQLISVHGGPPVWTAQYAITLQQRHYTLPAGVTLANAATGWEITAVTPSDPDQVLVPDARDNIPAAPPAARKAARALITSWLEYTYGHATARQLQDLTTSLRANLAASPPDVPPAMRALHPRITNIALSKAPTAGGRPAPRSPTATTATHSSSHSPTHATDGSSHRSSKPDKPAPAVSQWSAKTPRTASRRRRDQHASLDRVTPRIDPRQQAPTRPHDDPRRDV